MPARWLALLGLMVALAGCGEGMAPLAALWASPTPTATPTPTVTPTPTPSPTPTATPTPTPAPLAATLEVEPQSPFQGQTVRVRVRLDRAATVHGSFDGQALTFLYRSPTDAWALVGVPAWSPVGERPLIVEAVAPDGQGRRFSLALPVGESPFELQSIDVSPEQGGLLVPGLRQAEDVYLEAQLETVLPAPLWEGPFGIPSEGIRTSPFGARRSYAGGPVTAYHGGLDFAAAEGTAIFAAAAGEVVLAEPLRVRGNTVILNHGAGVFTLYFHLASLAVQPGQRLARGELIGAMGSTGLSTGAHLHWEVRVGPIFVDPDEWLARDFRPPPG